MIGPPVAVISWTTVLEPSQPSRNLGLARRDHRRPGTEAIASRPFRNPEAEITSRPPAPNSRPFRRSHPHPFRRGHRTRYGGRETTVSAVGPHSSGWTNRTRFGGSREAARGGRTAPVSAGATWTPGSRSAPVSAGARQGPRRERQGLGRAEGPYSEASLPMAGSPQGPAASGARKDVTGIPVSVLLSGVEALTAPIRTARTRPAMLPGP
jgi:hypothetical protein